MNKIKLIIILINVAILPIIFSCNNEVISGEDKDDYNYIHIEDKKDVIIDSFIVNEEDIKTIFSEPIENKQNTEISSVEKVEKLKQDYESNKITKDNIHNTLVNPNDNSNDNDWDIYNNQENNSSDGHSISLKDYIDGETYYYKVLFNRKIPDFIKNLFFEEAFNFLASTRIDDTFGRFALNNYIILQPSRLSISSSIRMMLENENITQEEIDKNMYKNVIFPDLLITPNMLTDKLPIEIAKILYAFDNILNNKYIDSSFKNYYNYYPEEQNINLLINKEHLELLNLDNEILDIIIESIIKNIDFFNTYTNYDFYKILNHPYMTPYVIKSFRRILSNEPLKINPGLFMKLDIEEELIHNVSLRNAIKDEITNGQIRSNINNNKYINSKFIKSVIITTILFNYLYSNDIKIKNTQSIVTNINNLLPTSSDTINELLSLCIDILNSSFAKSYVVTDKLIRLYYQYHLSAGISGMSYGSVSWSYKGYENTVLTLISGDYRIYQMPMDTRKLIEIDNIYKQTREKDIFLPIFNFEYSDYANKAVINVARPTYVNSYIFDFRKYQYKEVTEFFDRKVFTARSFMNTTKTKIIAQSLNAENEKDDLILVNLRNYKTEKLLSNCKIDNIEISPSDRNILITGNMDTESDEDISKPYIYNLMKKELIPLPFIADWNSFSWDLDEEKIYYIVNNKDLYLYNVANNKNRKIFSSDLYIYNMSIGRDMIAFSYLYPDTGKNILILYNTQTKKSQIIDEVYDGVIRSGFSPNSDFLFYEVVNHEDFKDLYLLKIK